MIEMLAAIVVFALVIIGMAIGVLRGREAIQGSCGGLNNLGVDGACEICGGDPMKCEMQHSLVSIGQYLGARLCRRAGHKAC